MSTPSSAGRPLCDPSQSGDPVAERILWTPLRDKGATSRRTHRVAMCGEERLEFRPTLQARLLTVVLLASGCALPVTGATIGMRGGSVNAALALIATGLVLGAVGVYFLFDLRQPRVFDRRSGTFRLGGRGLGTRERSLEEIHALQIVSRYVTMDDSPDFYCHELNLVLESGARHNVIAHGSYRHLRDDAELLSQFLNVPVWDESRFA